ncbi:MAG: metallophosphoesterase family protein [Faecalibacterium sp.]|nr:metallophosphoesterase family protein [Faecalibacterium sp.]
MKILALADEPCQVYWGTDARTRLAGIDLILSCGDLPHHYLEYLTNYTTAPIGYVNGNHDREQPGGCLCAEDTVVKCCGLRIAGLGGSIRYDPHAEHQYTEQEMTRRAAKLNRAIRKAGGVDILLAHSPARGLNDGPDFAHTGFDCFNRLLDEHTPDYFIHGHVHFSYNPALPRVVQRGETTVINACERHLFELADRPAPAPKPAKGLWYRFFSSDPVR